MPSCGQADRWYMRLRDFVSICVENGCGTQTSNAASAFAMNLASRPFIHCTQWRVGHWKKRGKERNRMRETNHNVLRPCPTKCARTKVSVNVSCITACCSYSSNLEKMRSIFRARYLKLSLSTDILCGNLLKALWICPLNVCYRWRKTTSSFT